MPKPVMPHPHLVVLRSAATVALSCIIAQAGWAAALLGGEGHYLRYHRAGAWVTLVVVTATAVGYVVLRRSAGTVNVALAVALAVAVSLQFTLGRIEGAAIHIFVGVLVAMLATSLTSWTYRHRMPGAVAA
jgi:hypothetical protein